MDTASIAKIRTAHPIERDNMLFAYNEIVRKTSKGTHPVVDQVVRTFAESDKIYQQGRTTPGEIVSNAPAGHSWHNYGLAWDIHIIRDGKDIWFDTTPKGALEADRDKDYFIIINIMSEHGYNWGGSFQGEFRDVPHFENKHGHTISELLQMHIDGKFIPGTTYLDI